MKEYVLYGLPKGETRPCMEDIIVNTTDEGELEKAKEKAKEKGFTNLRVAVHQWLGEKPDFTGTINIK